MKKIILGVMVLFTLSSYAMNDMEKQLLQCQELSKQLGIAAQIGDLQEVQRLVDLGIDPCMPSSEYGATPLHSAAFFGHSEVVYFLVDCGADINRMDAYLGQSPFHAAVERGHGDIVKFFALRGANIHALDGRGRTPYEIAQMRAQDEIRKLIYKIDEQQHNARNSLTKSVKSGNYTAIYKLFNDPQVDVNEQDENGNTPLMYAVLNGDAILTALLIKHGAIKTITNKEKKSAIDFALEVGKDRLQNLLID